MKVFFGEGKKPTAVDEKLRAPLVPIDRHGLLLLDCSDELTERQRR